MVSPASSMAGDRPAGAPGRPALRVVRRTSGTWLGRRPGDRPGPRTRAAPGTVRWCAGSEPSVRATGAATRAAPGTVLRLGPHPRFGTAIGLLESGRQHLVERADGSVLQRLDRVV